MNRKDYEKIKFRLGLGGMSISRRRDIIAETKMSFMRNVREYSSGAITPRPGLGSKIASSAVSYSDIHSLRRFQDPQTGTAHYIVGAAAALYYLTEGSPAPSALTTTLSGNKLQICFARPLKSSRQYAFIADGVNNNKLDFSGNLSQWSIDPLNVPPSVRVGVTPFKQIDVCEAVGTWTNGGTAGAVALGGAPRITFAIPAGSILYDTGSTGWAMIIPAAMDSNFQTGVMLKYNPGGGTEEYAQIDSIFEATPDTTVASIQYDSGSTGPCVIQLSTPGYAITPNTVIKLTTGLNIEFVRVTEVITGPTGLPSVRCSTTYTHAAASTVNGVRSYRVYLTKNHAAGETVSGEYLTSSIAVGTGTVTNPLTLDLTGSSDTPPVPFGLDDQIHISVRLSDPSLLTELRIELDCDSTTNDFTRNYFYYAVQPSAFNTSTTTLTAAQIDLQRELIQQQTQKLSNKYNQNDPNQYPYYDPNGILENSVSFTQDQTSSNTSGVSDAVTGTSQWTELVIKLSDFVRIGSDSSRGWKDIKSIRLQAVVTNTLTLDWDSWYIEGGKNLYTGIGADYNWVAVQRNRATGQQSLPSPALRSGITIDHGYAVLTATTSSDAQVTDIDFYRVGGTLTVDYFFVGSVPSPGVNSTVTFVDNFPDNEIQSNPSLNRENYPVFPVLDNVAHGTATLKGNMLTTLSGDQFNTKWAAGLSITITDSSGNSFYTLTYARPYSSGSLELAESLGINGTVTWSIAEPVLLGQGISSVFGPYLSGDGGVYLLACGTSLQAGTVYWTNPNDPCSTSLRNQLEVTSPEEPLVAGCIYDGQAFVFSTKRMFRIFATGSADLPFYAQEVANSKGVISPSCLTVGQVIYFVGSDGLYASTGGQPYAISDKDMYPVFPHDSQAGVLTNGIYPMDYSTTSYINRAHLCYHNDFLYFTFITTQTPQPVYKTLVFDLSRNSGGGESDIDESGKWVSLDDYNPVVHLHYSEEGVPNPRLLAGTANGYVFQLDSTMDNGVPFQYEFETRSFDMGSPRNQKFIPQLQFDHELNGCSVDVSARLDLSSTLTPLITYTSSSREIVEMAFSNLIPISSMPLSIGIHWSGYTQNGANPNFYIAYIDYSDLSPETSTSWFSQWTANGLPGWQHIRDAFITYSSLADCTMTINADGTDYTYTLPATGGTPKKYYLPICAIKAKLFSFTISSTKGFKLYNEDSEIRIKPWGSQGAYNVIRPMQTL